MSRASQVGICTFILVPELVNFGFDNAAIAAGAGTAGNTSAVAAADTVVQCLPTWMWRTQFALGAVPSVGLILYALFFMHESEARRTLVTSWLARRLRSPATAPVHGPAPASIARWRHTPPFDAGALRLPVCCPPAPPAPKAWLQQKWQDQEAADGYAQMDDNGAMPQLERRPGSIEAEGAPANPKDTAAQLAQVERQLAQGGLPVRQKAALEREAESLRKAMLSGYAGPYYTCSPRRAAPSARAVPPVAGASEQSLVPAG